MINGWLLYLLASPHQKGGTVLVPGAPSRSVQVIDVRDLAAWIVEKVEERATGVYNVTGHPISFKDCFWKKSMRIRCRP